MPQQDWFEQNRRPVTPTTYNSDDWFEQNRRPLTPTPTPPQEPRKTVTSATPKPPTITGKSNKSKYSSWIQDPTDTASLAWSAGKRLFYDLPKGIYESSPAAQMGSGFEALRKAEADPHALDEEMKQFTEARDEAVQSPYAWSKGIANALDPTGVVPSYVGLGESTVEDIKNKNYGGAAANVAVGALPFLWPGGKAAGRRFGYPEPDVIKPPPEVTVHPPEGPKRLPPGPTTEYIPDDRQLTTGFQNRGFAGKTRETRALPPVGGVSPGLAGDAFAVHPSGTVVPPLGPRNPSNLVSKFGINTPPTLETLRGNELTQPGTTVEFSGDPTKANALAPIESLPKVDTSVVQTQVNILPDVTQPKPVGGTVVGRKLNKPVTRLPSAPVIPRPVPPVVAQSPVVQQPPIPQAPIVQPPTITQPQLPPVQQPVVQQPVVQPPTQLAPVDTSVVQQPVAQLPAVSQPVNITPAEKAAGIAWNKEGNNYRSGEFHIVPDTKISNKTGADQRVRKTGSWTLYHNDKPISYGSLAKVKNKAIDYATKGPAVEAVEPVVEPVKEAPTKMAKGTFVEDKPVRKPGLALEPFEGRNGPSIGVWENNEKGGGSSLGQVEPRNDKFRARVEDKDLGLFDTQQDAVNAVLNQTGRRHLIPKETGIEPVVKAPEVLAAEPIDKQLIKSFGKEPPFGEPNSIERYRYAAWQHGQAWRVFQEKLNVIQQKDPKDVHWGKDWQGDTKVRSIKEAKAEIEYFKDREQQAIERIKQHEEGIDTSVVKEPVRELPAVQSVEKETGIASPKIQRAWTQAIRDEMSTGVSLEKARENVYKRAPGFAEDARVNPKKFIEHAKNQLVNKAEVEPARPKEVATVEPVKETPGTEIAKSETPTDTASSEQINKLLEKGYKPSSLQGLSPTEADALIRQRYNPDFDFPDDVAPEGHIEPAGNINVAEHEKLIKKATDFIRDAEALLNDFKYRNPKDINWAKEWPGRATNTRDARLELDAITEARNDAVKAVREHYSGKGSKPTTGAPKVKDSIAARNKEVGQLWTQMRVDDAVSSFTNRESVFLDAGGKLTPQELSYVRNEPTVRLMHVLVDDMFDSIVKHLGLKQVSDRLKRTGLLMHQHGPNMATYGFHIPNTNLADVRGQSAIVLNIFEHIKNFSPREAARRIVVTGWHETAHVGEGVPDKNTYLQLRPEDFTDPRNGEYFVSYVNEVINQGLLDPNSGHGTDFLQRLGEIYVKTGPKLFNEYVDQFHGLLTGGQFNSSYSPEVQKLLSIYKGSRGRGSTVPDVLSGETTQPSNQRLSGEGHISSIDKANGDGVPLASKEVIKEKKSTKKDENLKALERALDLQKRGITPEGIPTKQNWGGKSKTVKLGEGATREEIKANEPELDTSVAEDLPSAVPEPKKPLHERMGFESNKFDRIANDIKDIDPETGEVASLRRKMKLEGEARKEAAKIAAEEAAVKAKETAAKEAKKKEATAQKNAKRDAKKAEREAKKESVRKTVDDIIKEKAAKNPIINTPTFAGAVKALPERFRNSDVYKTVYDPLGVSNIERIRRMGPAGEALAKLMRDERTETNRAAGQEHAKLRQIYRDLTEAEQTEIAEIMDEQKPISEASSKKVRDAYTVLRESTDFQGDEAVKADVRMKDARGRNVPFEKLKGEYWPHIYPEELFKDPKSLREKLIKAGNSSVVVDAMMDRITKYGERFSSSQHARTFNLPGYRMDLGALEKHQYEMARAITRAKKYGPLDVADTNSKISELIRRTTNPDKARELVNDYLNRTDYGNLDAEHRVYNKIVKWEVLSKLSQFGITNMGDLVNIASNLGVRETAKQLAKTIANPHGSADIAASTGAHIIINKELHNSVKNGELLGSAYGTTGTEKLNRTVGALMGRVETQRLFKKAKKNPGKWAKTLAEFVDGDVDEVLKQDKLTREQIDFGGGRAVELTSGTPDKLDLSEAFYAKHPLLKLPLLFKRFAFVNTKNIKAAIDRQPTNWHKAAKLATILAAYQVGGEAVGDAKAAIKGLVAGDLGKALGERGNYIASGNKYLDRVLANYMQSYLFGLVGDVSESIARKHSGKVTGTLGGPFGGDLDELAYDAIAAYGGDLKPAAKSAVTRIPFIGAGLEERWAKKGLGMKDLDSNTVKMKGLGR